MQRRIKAQKNNFILNYFKKLLTSEKNKFIINLLFKV